jgi:hypothetical protein
MDDLDAFEDDLIDRFRSHPVLQAVPSLGADEFHKVLLQRRFLSLAFTPAYDLAIDLLTDEQGLELARVILREEYPGPEGRTRSHREDMKEDLLWFGISRPSLVGSRPSQPTLHAINSIMELISDAGSHEHADACLLTILRFWGEVLVSAEYGVFWPRMAPLLSEGGKIRSVFYYPHYVHDAKATSLAATSLLSSTHSDQLGMRLWQLLSTPAARAGFREMETRILEHKLAFYDQFSSQLLQVS